MYGIEYTSEILSVIRVLKYVHDRKPEEFKRLVDFFETIDYVQMAEIMHHAMWMMFDDVIGGTEFMEEYEYETIEFTHSSFSKYLAVGSKWANLHGRSSNLNFQRKLEDLCEFFLEGPTYTVCRRECSASSASFRVKLWFSEDFGVPPDFGTNLLDLLLYVERETAWLEKQMEEMQGTVLAFPEQNREEAA